MLIGNSDSLGDVTKRGEAARPQSLRQILADKYIGWGVRDAVEGKPFPPEYDRVWDRARQVNYEAGRAAGGLLLFHGEPTENWWSEACRESHWITAELSE